MAAGRGEGRRRRVEVMVVKNEGGEAGSKGRTRLSHCVTSHCAFKQKFTSPQKKSKKCRNRKKQLLHIPNGYIETYPKGKKGEV